MAPRFLASNTRAQLLQFRITSQPCCGAVPQAMELWTGTAARTHLRRWAAAVQVQQAARVDKVQAASLFDAIVRRRAFIGW